MKYNYKVIGERICTERKKLGYSQLQLMAALNERGIPKGRNRISEIENGTAKRFECDFLFALCDIFDCELGYLLGEYDQKTGRETDICRETGLTANAIAYLKECQDLDIERIEVISSIIESHPWELLETITAAIDARIDPADPRDALDNGTSYIDVGTLALTGRNADFIDSILSTKVIKSMDKISDRYKQIYGASPYERMLKRLCK